jgi:hypothetical protein
MRNGKYDERIGRKRRKIKEMPNLLEQLKKALALMI